MPDYDFLVKAKCGHKLMSKSNENGIWQDVDDDDAVAVAAAGPRPSPVSASVSASVTVATLAWSQSHAINFVLRKNDRNAFIDQMRSSSSITRLRLRRRLRLRLQLRRGSKCSEERRGGVDTGQTALANALTIALGCLQLACLLGKVVAAHMSYT